MTNIFRPLLILLWAIAVVPVDLLCIVAIVVFLGIGYDGPTRPNSPLYFLVLLLIAGAAIASTLLAWFSLRLWAEPKWRRASFALVLSYYAILGVIDWMVVVKHWIK